METHYMTSPEVSKLKNSHRLLCLNNPVKPRLRERESHTGSINYGINYVSCGITEVNND